MRPRRFVRPSRRARSRRRLWWVIGGVAAFAVVIVGIVATVKVSHELAASPPAVGTRIAVPADSKAARAAASTSDPEEKAAAQFLAAQPTAYWLTPEETPPGSAGQHVQDLIESSREQDAALVLVVYGLPERDCGNFSAGGLSPEAYTEWIEEIAGPLHAAGDVRKIVIVEPDSLALAPECGNLDQRLPELRMVVDRLASTNTWLYLDGGHSNWLPASEMAELISAVGVQDAVRGFATNVSNFQADADEFAYARELSSLLGGAHAVIDSSRNGAGSTGEWCNPAGRLIGEAPGTFGDDVVDTNLWIKPPGESDGECNGGPGAGQWWPDAAKELTREAR
ncbi:glycoside hydrolase family 6 protein [Microbacterium sp. NPDC078428]|uniref:glycoside hydrolase family 6 protein n=1 Tax=Microbacterium sp. NPDC078428 TaxID=3364190 RepID=UPI0037C6D350